MRTKQFQSQNGLILVHTIAIAARLEGWFQSQNGLILVGPGITIICSPHKFQSQNGLILVKETIDTSKDEGCFNPKMV
ncbi:hypothetical protein MB9_0871 [Methanobacterium formicicum]|uniref:Uncharacterized protein n=1 Tax=Methanobacterium formicicum TaxID=2162 RepID=A0A0S4FN82_METFO|nr:hypothetical protein MB9_0871 [Methanobacterium formicicum]